MRLVVGRRVGLIPAHAGKTARTHSGRGLSRAHPRSRGENGENDDIAGLSVGSSPLTRGKQASEDTEFWAVGLIPAHAGKTPQRRRRRSCRAAHPRSRGENITWIAQLITSCGSSPLTRGKRVGTQRHRCGRRLIPAHAGKTCRCRRAIRLRRAHPRSRGENYQVLASIKIGGGSSPLTRGKPASRGPFFLGVGLIPAHAGKTCMYKWPVPYRGAHPRSRGENIMSRSYLRSFWGSSPLTRGKQDDSAAIDNIPRLIPAHAGKTRSMDQRPGTRRAHPRSRGENPFPSTK